MQHSLILVGLLFLTLGMVSLIWTSALSGHGRERTAPSSRWAPVALLTMAGAVLLVAAFLP